MATREHIEHHLIQMGQTFETIEDGMWVLRDPPNIVIIYRPPLIIFRSKLMEIPKKNREEFYKCLLTLNASEMVHGAYGLEDSNVVIIDTLEAENLNFNEFEASVEAITLAVSQDYQKLKPFFD
ncbi:MAG: hypothetical protein ACRENG_38480 [bacterium]